MTDVQTKTAKKVLNIVANVLVWAFVALSLLTTVLVFSAQKSEDGVPALFGKSWITVETDSMEPTIKKGSLFVINKNEGTAMNHLVEGDVITYFAPIDINGDGEIGDINTHRIVEANHDKASFVTKGDHNLIKDNEGDDAYTVSYADVIGYVKAEDVEKAAIGGVGTAIGFLRSSLGFFLCIVLPLILFFLYELYRFIVLLVAERAKSKPVDSDTEEEIKRRAIEEYLKQQAAANAAQAPAAPAETAETAEAAAPAEENGDNKEDKAE